MAFTELSYEEYGLPWSELYLEDDAVPAVQAGTAPERAAREVRRARGVRPAAGHH